MGAKGKVAEREVAKLLCEWWRPFEPFVGDKPLMFVRTPMSGGWAHAEGLDARGDVMTNSRTFPFSVEVKRQERWKVDILLAGKQSPVWAWWRQCQRDAQAVRREPMLWFRQNRRPWVVMVRADYLPLLGEILVPKWRWGTDLSMRVDCGAHPVLFDAEDLLRFDPQLFIPRATCPEPKPPRPSPEAKSPSRRRSKVSTRSTRSPPTTGT